VAAAGAARGAASGGAAGSGGLGGPAVLQPSGSGSAGGGAGGVGEFAAPAGGVGSVDHFHAGGADGRSGAADAAVENPRELPGFADRAAVFQGPDPWRCISNLTPYGGNVEGIGAAAWFYFGKGPDQLSLGEIALLTALPRSPLRYDPTLHPAGGPDGAEPGARPARVARSVLAEGAGCGAAAATAEEAAPAAVPGSSFHRDGGGSASWGTSHPDHSRTAPCSRSPSPRWRGGPGSCGTRGSATPRWW